MLQVVDAEETMDNWLDMHSFFPKSVKMESPPETARAGVSLGRRIIVRDVPLTCGDKHCLVS